MISNYLRNNILGLIAIFLALGGVGYAAGLKKNSVKSKQIKNGQVRTADVGAGAVTADKLAADSVSGVKIAGDSVTGADVAESSLNIPASSVDTSGLQSRVSGDCQPGESIRAIAADGTVACQGGGGPPSGTAGGDLSGAYPDPQLAANVVGGSEVSPNAIGGSDIDETTLFNDDTLAANDLAPLSVGTSEVAVDSLGETDLATGSVGTAEVASDALGANDIGIDAVGSSEIGTAAVGTSEVALDSLAATDLAPDSVGASEIGQDTVAASELAPNGVASANVIDNALTAEDIGADEIGGSELAPDSVTSGVISDGGVAKADVNGEAVGGSELTDVFVKVNDVSAPANENTEASISCPAGATGIGGGGGATRLAAEMRLIQSGPAGADGNYYEEDEDGDTFTRWDVTARNQSFTTLGQVTAYIVCIGS